MHSARARIERLRRTAVKWQSVASSETPSGVSAREQRSVGARKAVAYTVLLHRREGVALELLAIVVGELLQEEPRAVRPVPVPPVVLACEDEVERVADDVDVAEAGGVQLLVDLLMLVEARD